MAKAHEAATDLRNHMVGHVLLVPSAFGPPAGPRERPIDRFPVALVMAEDLVAHRMGKPSESQVAGVKWLVAYRAVAPVAEGAHQRRGEIARPGPHGDADGRIRFRIASASLIVSGARQEVGPFRVRREFLPREPAGGDHFALLRAKIRHRPRHQRGRHALPAMPRRRVGVGDDRDVRARRRRRSSRLPSRPRTGGVAPAVGPILLADIVGRDAHAVCSERGERAHGERLVGGAEALHERARLRIAVADRCSVDDS